MQVQDFIKAYQAKSDEELLELARTLEDLTSDAQLALKSELSRRNINVEQHLAPVGTLGDSAPAGIDKTGAPQRELDNQPRGAHQFVAEVLSIYHEHFWLFFNITAPAVVVGTVAVIIGRNEAREIARQLPRGPELARHYSEFLRMGLFNWGGVFVSSMVSAFSFAAGCVAVRDVELGTVTSVRGCFGEAWEHSGALMRVCLLLFFLILVAIAAAFLLLTAAFWALREAHSSLSPIWWMSYAVGGLALLVVSRFGLAIPAVVLDHYSATQSMFRSDELTEGKWLLLAAILGKCLVGGYVAAMLPFWLASWLIPASVSRPAWFPWLLTLASTIGVSMVEPTMFVGFALLYLRTSQLRPSTTPH